MLHCVSPSHWKTGRRDTGRYYTGMRTIALFSGLIAAMLVLDHVEQLVDVDPANVEQRFVLPRWIGLLMGNRVIGTE